MTSANPIASRVEFDTNGGCWLWTGYLTPQGYGNFRGRPAHRVSYEVWGLNNCEITWGDLRAARTFLANQGADQ